jgi:hypothetical protein
MVPVRLLRFAALYKVKVDVYVGQGSALGRYSGYDYDIYCRHLILNTSEDLRSWALRFTVLESAECLNGTWRFMLASPEATEWNPTVVTIVGRMQRAYLARAGRRARGSRDVQRTEVALLFLKYALFSPVDSHQGDIRSSMGMFLCTWTCMMTPLPNSSRRYLHAVLNCGRSTFVTGHQIEVWKERLPQSCPLARCSRCCSSTRAEQRISSWNTEVHLTDAFDTRLGRWCPLLRHVDLSRSKVTDATLVAISRGCAELQSLRLSETDVTDAGLKAIGEGCRSLRAFSLWQGTEAVTDSRSRPSTWMLGTRADRHRQDLCL